MAETKNDEQLELLMVEGEDEAVTNKIPSALISNVNSSNMPPAFYIAVWIGMSSAVILFNKYILYELKFPFPIFLTTCHMVFATIGTRLLHRYTNMMKDLQKVQMTREIFLRAILPIGVLFSISLMASNMAYLYLTVAYIQMLKATTPVFVLVIGYAFQTEQPDMVVLGKVMSIVVGVIIASYGEFEFVFIGFVFQAVGILSEASRLVMIQKLLSCYKMGPLVSLHCFAPVCAVTNFAAFLVLESKSLRWDHVNAVGLQVLLLNCLIAFGLNIAVVFLIGKTSSVVMTLSGVLKDIILIVASVLLWATNISVSQIFGYGIALIGLVWYKEPNLDMKRICIAFVCLVAVSGLSGALYDLPIGGNLDQNASAYDWPNKTGGLLNIELAVNSSKTVITCFAGRRQYMDIMLQYVDALVERSFVDEVHLWDFTAVPEDAQYLQQFVAKPKYTVMNTNKREKAWEDYYQYYGELNGTNDDDVYIKLDDDTLFIDIEAFPSFIAFRRNNPHALWGSPNVINNGVTAYYQGLYKMHPIALPYDSYFGKLVTNGTIAEQLHEHFVGHIADMSEWIRQTGVIYHKLGDRLSINFLAFLAKDLPLIKDLGKDDEHVLTVLKTVELKRQGYIDMSFLTAHMAFGPQREGKDAMNQSHVLEMYRNFGRKYFEKLESKKVAP
ncbi:hypothetical protein SmJEL517_g02359 [Synchytrium microbalum]|uniref:Sugar phosphate transporter domain-containing protein n=1 Tax=Synchytrium microbalum TaxID=1806994 RepID=A0A507CCK8_9FUNG|nr:uncharacterized protein SmJEL517_g02359 [Synchytrium microbalum]TPX35295.1 hypothetical protein SmJEL517_g02359 [Synchytrium microbalum]